MGIKILDFTLILCTKYCFMVSFCTIATVLWGAFCHKDKFFLMNKIITLIPMWQLLGTNCKLLYFILWKWKGRKHAVLFPSPSGEAGSIPYYFHRHAEKPEACRTISISKRRSRKHTLLFPSPSGEAGSIPYYISIAKRRSASIWAHLIPRPPHHLANTKFPGVEGRQMGTRMKESVTNKIVFAGRKTLNIKVGGVSQD